MKILDANVLLQAYSPDFPHHTTARKWLEAAFSQSEVIGLPWTTLLAFLRISTNSRSFPRPFTIEEAVAIVSDWLERPGVSVAETGQNHWETLRHLILTTQSRGNLVMDAHLAALSLSSGATLCTNDRDFARFPGLLTLDPLAG